MAILILNIFWHFKQITIWQILEMKASEIFPSGENINSENESSGYLAYVNCQKANVLWRNFRIWAIMIVTMAYIIHTSCDEKRVYKEIYIFGSQIFRLLIKSFLKIISCVFWASLKTPFNFFAQNYFHQCYVCKEIVVKH